MAQKQVKTLSTSELVEAAGVTRQYIASLGRVGVVHKVGYGRYSVNASAKLPPSGPESRSRAAANTANSTDQRGCHPCLRYDLSPMCPGWTTNWLAGHIGLEPANPSASYLIGIAWQLRLRAAQLRRRRPFACELRDADFAPLAKISAVDL